MQKEIKELREAVEGLEKEVAALKSQNGTDKGFGEMQKKLKEMEDNISGLEQVVVELKGQSGPDVDPSNAEGNTMKDIADMKKQITELQKAVGEIKDGQKKDKQFEAIMNGIADMQKAITELKANQCPPTDSDLLKRISALEKRVGDLEQRDHVTSRRGISFTARGVHCTGQTIVFKDELNNDGNGYNCATGVFTTPCPGKYFFSLTMSIHGSHFAILSLMKNDSQEIGRVVPDKNHSSRDYDTAAVTTIADLNQNDTICVKLTGGESGAFGGQNARYLSTFCGALI